MVTPIQSVVVFSKNYLPIKPVNIKQTMTLLLTDKAKLLNFTVLYWEIKFSYLIYSSFGI